MSTKIELANLVEYAEKLSTRVEELEGVYEELKSWNSLLQSKHTPLLAKYRALRTEMERIRDISSTNHRCECGKFTGIAAIFVCATNALSKKAGRSKNNE